MRHKAINSSRRALFLKGGAVLGASVASGGAGAATLLDGSTAELRELRRRLDRLEDREALRELHLTFTALLDRGAWETLPALFTEDAEVELHSERASGEREVRKLFTEGYQRQEAAVLSGGHRRGPAQAADADRIDISEDGRTARASFHDQVLVTRPLRGQSSLADMARHQGMSEQGRWENGRYDVGFARRDGQWRINRLRYRKV